MDMPWPFLALDPYLIRFYRLTGYVLLDFYLGTFVLALHALALGELSLWLARRLVGSYLEETAARAKHYHDLSIEALKAGDKAAYEAANKLANEAFSKSFFQQLALSGAFFWPAPVALAWMQYRFLGVEIPLPGTDFSVGFIGAFILCYIPAYFLWKRLLRGAIERLKSEEVPAPPTAGD